MRLIGVNTPETKHPKKPVEYFGKEASAFTTREIEGQEIRLEYDWERKDKYGRTLAYVYRVSDGFFLNAEIIKQGYGHAYTRFPFRYLELFRGYENDAKRFGWGLWATSTTADAIQSPSYYFVRHVFTNYETPTNKVRASSIQILKVDSFQECLSFKEMRKRTTFDSETTQTWDECVDDASGYSKYFSGKPVGEWIVTSTLASMPQAVVIKYHRSEPGLMTHEDFVDVLEAAYQKSSDKYSKINIFSPTKKERTVQNL